MLLDSVQWSYFIVGLIGYIIFRIVLHFTNNKGLKQNGTNQPNKNEDSQKRK